MKNKIYAREILVDSYSATNLPESILDFVLRGENESASRSTKLDRMPCFRHFYLIAFYWSKLDVEEKNFS